MPPKFFITHSSKDIVFARRLCDDLVAHGLGGFFDATAIQPGDIISADVDKGLVDCDVYVPILSHAALQSRWCKEEIHTAITLSLRDGRNGRPRIIPVLIEDCADEMPAFLQVRLYIEFANRYDEAFKELLTKGFGVPVAPKPPKAISRVPGEPEPRDAKEYYDRARDFKAKGDLEQALAEYNQAIEICPESVLAHIGRANIYHKRFDLDRALADYNRALEINPEYADAYLNRGKLYRFLKGQRPKAIADFEAYLRLAPDVEDKAKVEGWIRELRK